MSVGDGRDPPGYAPSGLGEEGDWVAENLWAAVCRPQGLLTRGRLDVVLEKLKVEKGELGTRPPAAGCWP